MFIIIFSEHQVMSSVFVLMFSHKQNLKTSD